MEPRHERGAATPGADQQVGTPRRLGRPGRLLRPGEDHRVRAGRTRIGLSLAGRGPAGNADLNALAERYWRPIYRFIRVVWKKSPEDAPWSDARLSFTAERSA